MKPDIFTTILPGQVHFGFGAIELVGEAVNALGAEGVFIVADPGVMTAGLVEPIVALLKAANLHYVVYDKVVPNPDTQSVDAAGAAFGDSRADIIIGIGGGSGLDTAKAVSLVAGGPPKGCVAEYSPFLDEARRPIPAPKDLPPVIAIPTTAGTGSEVTPWAIITDTGAKCKFGVGGGSATVPTVALVDPGLTLTLPPYLTAATGMDALSHCIEAYVSTNENPMLDPMILYGIELIGRSLRLAVAQGDNHDARRDVMLGSLIGGIGITSKWLGACHALAHPLSSLAGIQHGIANALMLPHQMAYSLPAALDRYARIAEVLDTPKAVSRTARQQAERAVEAVRELVVDIGLPTHLQDLGITPKMIPELAAGAYQDGNWPSNPRSVSQEVMEQLYHQAF
jgi:alcohol dehydrogenase class IV